MNTFSIIRNLHFLLGKVAFWLFPIFHYLFGLLKSSRPIQGGCWDAGSFIALEKDFPIWFVNNYRTALAELDSDALATVERLSSDDNSLSQLADELVSNHAWIIGKLSNKSYRDKSDKYYLIMQPLEQRLSNLVADEGDKVLPQYSGIVRWIYLRNAFVILKEIKGLQFNITKIRRFIEGNWSVFNVFSDIVHFRFISVILLTLIIVFGHSKESFSFPEKYKDYKVLVSENTWVYKIEQKLSNGELRYFEKNLEKVQEGDGLTVRIYNNRLSIDDGVAVLKQNKFGYGFIKVNKVKKKDKILPKVAQLKGQFCCFNNLDGLARRISDIYSHEPLFKVAINKLSRLLVVSDKKDLIIQGSFIWPIFVAVFVIIVYILFPFFFGVVVSSWLQEKSKIGKIFYKYFISSVFLLMGIGGVFFVSWRGIENGIVGIRQVLGYYEVNPFIPLASVIFFLSAGFIGVTSWFNKLIFIQAIDEKKKKEVVKSTIISTLILLVGLWAGKQNLGDPELYEASAIAKSISYALQNDILLAMVDKAPFEYFQFVISEQAYQVVFVSVIFSSFIIFGLLDPSESVTMISSFWQRSYEISLVFFALLFNYLVIVNNFIPPQPYLIAFILDLYSIFVFLLLASGVLKKYNISENKLLFLGFILSICIAAQWYFL